MLASSSLLRSVSIRPYEPKDRSGVRRICCETADRGRPAERLCSDRELIADLVTRYYTDYEPGASWVAEQEGNLIGYLTGCLDPRAYHRIMPSCVIPGALLRATLRGLLVRPDTWRIARCGLLTWRRGGFARRIPVERYPAHFHINLRQESRGQRVGEQLIDRFITQASRRGLRGIHLSVREDNHSACRFFERAGFRTISRHPVVLPDDGGSQVRYAAIYAKSL